MPNRVLAESIRPGTWGDGGRAAARFFFFSVSGMGFRFEHPSEPCLSGEMM